MASLGEIFLFETAGTAILLLMGASVVANVLLAKTGGNGGGTLMINIGWGLAVFSGVFVAYKSGAHLNPAVTLGMWASGAKLSLAQVATYLAGQFVGAFIGAVGAWLAYRLHFDDPESDVEAKLDVFATRPAIVNSKWNLITEIIATFALVFVILTFGKTPSELGPLAVALLVIGIGASLGGPTGYAINPARDLAPRLAHRLLPIKNKGTSNFGYAWIPVIGPSIGGILAGLLAHTMQYV